MRSQSRCDASQIPCHGIARRDRAKFALAPRVQLSTARADKIVVTMHAYRTDVSVTIGKMTPRCSDVTPM
jgi:hypothetical protein